MSGTQVPESVASDTTGASPSDELLTPTPRSTSAATTEAAFDTESDDSSSDTTSAGALSTPPHHEVAVPIASASGVVTLIDASDRLVLDFQNLGFAPKHQAPATADSFGFGGEDTGNSMTKDDEEEEKDRDDENGGIDEKEDDTDDEGHAKNDDDDHVDHDWKKKPSLADLQALCRACGVDEEDVPGSTTKCKNLLSSYHVNLCDLAEALRRGHSVSITFSSVGALAKYSKQSKKFFSKAAAKDDRLLRLMLRPLFAPRSTRIKGRK